VTDPLNRLLLVLASAYLFLLPTNAATFGVSVAFGGAMLCAFGAYFRARRHPATRIAMAGPSILVPLALWSLWSCASLAWSADPAYSRGQLAREVMDSLAVMFIFYVAGREASGLRVLIGAALASFACFALLAIGMRVGTGAWDPGRFHHGVGAWATFIVMVAPFLFALIVPPPAGFGGGVPPLVIGFALLALMIATARMTDSRIVWIALAAVFATASLIAAIRWPQTFVRTPLRWLAPLCVLLIVLGLAFADTIEERAQISANGSVAVSIERDPRLVLWEHVIGYLEARPLTGYGFGRLILEKRLTAETGNPLLSHPHNVFVSQWLQTGLVGMIAFIAFLAALALRYVRFARSRDDTLAFVGVVGLALLAGFVAKDLTDDFLFRSNAKELWAMTAMLLGYGVRRERDLDDALRSLEASVVTVSTPGRPKCESAPKGNSAAGNPVSGLNAAAAPARARPPTLRQRRSESA
jgi:O-antigen ligase